MRFGIDEFCTNCGRKKDAYAEVSKSTALPLMLLPLEHDDHPGSPCDGESNGHTDYSLVFTSIARISIYE